MGNPERRAQLLECARDVFAEKGYHGASISDVIGRAGVARGTFYLYFPSKRSIFDALLERQQEALLSRIIRVDVDSGPAVVIRDIKANLAAIFDVLAGDPALGRILFHEAVGLDQGFDEKLAQFYGHSHQYIAESLELGQAMGLIRPLDTQLVARFLLGACKELLFEQTLAKEPLQDAEKAVDEIVNFYLRGIADTAVLEELS